MGKIEKLSQLGPERKPEPLIYANSFAETEGDVDFETKSTSFQAKTRFWEWGYNKIS
jgi:hypothetical protein